MGAPRRAAVGGRWRLTWAEFLRPEPQPLGLLSVHQPVAPRGLGGPRTSPGTVVLDKALWGPEPQTCHVPRSARRSGAYPKSGDCAAERD